MNKLPTIPLGESPRILLVRLSAIGDVVVATPVIRALRQAFPSAHLAWLVEEKAAEIVRGHPALDEVIVWPRERWVRLGRARALARHLSFVRELRTRRYDVAIDFQGLLRSGVLVRAVGARYRIASEGTREGSAVCYNIRVPRTGDPSSRQRCLDLLRPLGVEGADRRMEVWFGPEAVEAAQRLALRAPRSALEQAADVTMDGGSASCNAERGARSAEHASAARGERREPRIVCLCPATTWRHKHWREEGWSAVADGLARDGLTPIFMGAAGDRPLLERILGRMERSATIAAGETSLKEAAALLARASLAITVDTGLMHVAVAVGTPVVALCGPSYWPGFQDYEHLRLIRKPFPCSPCLRHPTCANDDCMTAITPAEVLAEARAALSGKTAISRQPSVKVKGGP